MKLIIYQIKIVIQSVSERVHRNSRCLKKLWNQTDSNKFSVQKNKSTILYFFLFRCLKIYGDVLDGEKNSNLKKRREKYLETAEYFMWHQEIGYLPTVLKLEVFLLNFVLFLIG